MIQIEVNTNDTLMISDSVFSQTVSDAVKHRTVEFLFPPSWQEYQKTAVFSADDVEPINILLDSDNELCVTENQCYIPFEVLKGDRFYVSVFGVKGESLATTTKIAVEVKESGYALGDAPCEPTPEQYQQIIDIMVKTEEIAQSVRDDADNGVFDGKQGIDGKDAVTDLVYNPESGNAQSGKAVAQAMENAVTPEKIKNSIEGTTFIFDGGNAFDSFEDETMIDSEMSDYSENPVQNKVIKGYIDTFISNTMTNVNDEFEAVRLETNESIENTATEIKSLIYPVGSVYIADSVNINPATIFGGEWELFDKEFESSSGDLDASNFELQNGTTFFKTSDTNTGISFVREGHNLRFRINVTLGTDLGDSKVNILRVKDFSLLGISGFDYNFYNTLSGCDGSNAVLIANFENNGWLGTTDVVGQNSGTAKSGGVAFFDITIPVKYSQMLDEYCDKFYWRRIA